MVPALFQPRNIVHKKIIKEMVVWKILHYARNMQTQVLYCWNVVNDHILEVTHFLKLQRFFAIEGVQTGP